MSETPLDEGRRSNVVTWRALLAGSICVLIISTAEPYASLKMRSSSMALDFSVPAAIFMTFMLVVVVNLTRFITKRSILNRGETLVAFAMMAIAAAICTMGLTAYLVPQLAAPTYFASPENRWEEVLLRDTPEWLMVSPRGAGRTAIQYMFEGLPAAISTQQLYGIIMAWARPLAYWSIFLLALYASSISLMAIFRKQWVEDERIVFPLAQLPVELAQPPEPGRKATPLLKNRLMWLGFAIPFIYSSLRGLPNYLPHFAAIAPTEQWSIQLLQDYWQILFRISWQTIGLAYLISLDMSLCVWVFALLGTFYDGVSGLVGFRSSEVLGLYGAAPYPDLGHFGMGAMIAMVFLRLWIGRRHLGNVLKRAFFMKTDIDDTDEPMSYRTAVWITIACFIVMTVWLCFSGFSLPVALLVLFAAFIGFVGLTRIIAESGMPVSIVPLVSSDYVVSAIGTSAIGREGLLALPWTYVWNSDVRTFVMSSAAHGMRACSDRRSSYRGLFLAMLLAVVLAVAASVSFTLYLAYQHGGINLSGWYFSDGPAYPFNFATGLIENLEQGEPRSPNPRGWTASLIGASVMVLFTMARHSFVWWPLNPVGLPIAVVRWTRHLWFSVFLAWLFKSRILKYGGPKLYIKLRPIFLGLVLGQYSAAALWAAISAIADMPGASVFWI